jgi:hypothetical protein
MSTKTTRTIVGVMAGALALTSLSIEPVRAASATPKAPVAAPAKADTTPTDISTQRRRHYRGGGNPAQALAMFGIVAGSIAAISASRRHRHGHGVYYPHGGYGPGYGYYGPRPYAYQPYGYQPYGYGGYGYRY